MDIAPILICYDGTVAARHAIDMAATLLGARRAVVLDVARVLTGAESYAIMSSSTGGAELEQLNTEEALDNARTGAEHARRAGFEATGRGELAAPTWEAIVDVADEVGASLIVVGSRGLSGARELFEGSVSHQVVEHAGRPVLIVPPPNRRR